MITLETAAVVGASFVIRLEFEDENGDAMTPDSVTWSLYNGDDEVVNNRDSVSLSPASSIDVVLTPDDVDPDDGVDRVFIVSGTYTSSLGSGLTLRDSARFTIEVLPDV